MAGTFRSLYLHAVFSTKARQPLLAEPERNRMCCYLAAILREMECDPVVVGGYFEHVHLAAGLPTDLSPAVLIREAKSRSSRWAKRTLPGFDRFSWQTGYAAFSFSRRNLEAVCRYVNNQESHHAIQSFEEEYLELLGLAGIDYDERFVFDD